MPRQRITPLEAACRGCGAKYRPSTSWQRFCGEACRRDYWSKRRLVDKTDLDRLRSEVEERLARLEFESEAQHVALQNLARRTLPEEYYQDWAAGSNKSGQ